MCRVRSLRESGLGWVVGFGCGRMGSSQEAGSRGNDILVEGEICKHLLRGGH